VSLEIQLYNPYDKQQLLHKYCDLSSPNFWTVCISGRQAGKSTAAENQAIYWALSDERSLVWYVAPTEAQALKVYNDINNAFPHRSPFIKSKKASKGSIEIIFKNGSKIEFKAAGSEDSLRGNSVNYLILDEGAYLKKSTIDEIIVPTLSTAGKKGLIISTPKGKNWLFTWYLKGLDVTNKYIQSVKFTSLDNPYSNKELIAQAKENIPEEAYQQEYLGEFVDSASVFRNIEELSVLTMQHQPIQGETYYAGIDIGMLNDDTVVSILNSKGELVYYDAFTKLESPEIKNRILSTLNKWKPRQTLIEENNQGLPILHLLKREYPTIEGFVTTNDSKATIINNLIAAFSSKEIRLINTDFIKLQLQGFVFEMTPSGKVRYCAASGFKDDFVMSLAIAWQAYVKHKRSGGRVRFY
jgi:PBSX family phage terminase large subunit